MAGTRTSTSTDDEEPRTRRNGGKDPNRRRGTPERRAELLDVAVKIFYRKGYVETTLQDIADEMGFTKPAIYYYAKNKEELLVEVYGQIVTRSIAAARDVAGRDGTGGERFVALIEQHLRTFLENIQANGVFEVQRTSLSAAATEQIQAWAREYNDILIGVYEEGVADGSLAPLTPRVTVNATIGMCNSVHRWYNPKGKVSRDALIAELCDLVTSGITVA